MIVSNNSLGDNIRHAEEQLKKAGTDNPALDARLLIAHVLRCDRAQLLGQTDRVLTELEQRAIEELIARRARREPVGRILGEREFWGLPFRLNEATLEPRPDSETLVEAVLKGVRGSGSRDQGNEPRILDLGTGTGCLLLALLHELPHATGLGVDCAPHAVEQAQENAERLGLAARVEFRTNNWMDGIDETFDLVISNPPYIASAEIPTLMPEVRAHDPQLALDGGADGLAAYRLLIPQLPRVLKPNGLAVFEIGEGQAEAVTEIFHQNGFLNVLTHRDLAGIERCVSAHIP